jgi:hypothetical protein
MGSLQAEEPVLGKEGVGPSPMIVTACNAVTWSTPLDPLLATTFAAAARRVRSAQTLSLKLYHLPPFTPSSRVASIRSVHTDGSASLLAGASASPARIAPAGTATGILPSVVSVTAPPSCTPLLHRHCPASSLL